MRLKIHSVGAALALAAGLTLVGKAQGDTIPVTNANFQSLDTTGWTATYSYGSAGQNNAITNPYGSSGFLAGTGASNSISGAPAGVTTAGQLNVDSGDTANQSSPNPPYDTPPPDTNGASFGATGPRDPITNIPDWETFRSNSGEGDLGSFYQNLGVTFAANTTYTLTAYASGESSQNNPSVGPNAFSNTGVGLSGGSALTMLEIDAAPGVYNSYAQSSGYTLQEETLTINTADAPYTTLVGQDIIVNLLDNIITTGGGRSAYFTAVTLTSTPEPTSAALLIGAIPMMMRRRRRAIAGV
jgi:hypothetical protein